MGPIMHRGVPLGSLFLLLASACGPRDTGVLSGFVDVSVAAVAAPLAGQVSEVLVREGDRVHRGQVLVRLDARERAALVQEAEAEVTRAREALAESEQNASVAVPGVRVAAADVARQQAELLNAEQEYARRLKLLGNGAATQADVDAARARLDAARAMLLGSGASQSVSRGRVSLAQAGVGTARAALLRSEAALNLASVQLDELSIASPFDGVVAELNLQPGEWAAPGSAVVTVEDLGRKWVRVDVEETALAAVRVGAPASVRALARPDKRYAGKVIEIGAEAEFAMNRDVKRGRPDVRTFRVRVGLDAPHDELRPGMTAEVSFDAEAKTP
jgi:HlyD family secretion protein